MIKYGRIYQKYEDGTEEFIGVGLYDVLVQQTKMVNEMFGMETQFVDEITEEEFYEGVKEMGLS